jgi:hypothetical protein
LTEPRTRPDLSNTFPIVAERAMPSWLALPALVALASGVSLIAWYWRDGIPYDATSGVWLALADDWSHGILYRPLHDASGFGGTRYMPLFFMLHGWLMRAGLPIVTAGAALTLLSLALFAGGIFRTCRALGVTSATAACCAALLLSSISVQLLGIAVKGDLLAAALNIWGVCFALHALRANDRVAATHWTLAFVCFALAVATKITAVFGAATVVLWFARRGRTRAALSACAMFAVLILSVFMIANVMSTGGMLASFSAVADGGAGLRYAVLAPWWLLRAAVQDPFMLVIAVGAGILAVRSSASAVHSASSERTGDSAAFVALWLGVTVAGTLFIFATPGTDANHLVDLLAVSLAIVALELPRYPHARIVSAAFALLLVVSLLPGMPGIRQFFHERGRPTWSGIAVVRAIVADARVLAENPAVPLLLGQRPEVLDPFSLRVIAARDADVARDFAQRVSAGHYNAVVLMDWSGSDRDDVRTAIDSHTGAGGVQFFGGMNFPDGFLELLWQHYDVSEVVPPFVVLERR